MDAAGENITKTASGQLSIPARFFLYGLIGWCTELVFTSVADQLTGGGDARLLGYSYLWMHPIWGFGILACEYVGRWMKSRRFHVITRGIVYAGACFAIEYVAGFLLAQTVGRAPWDYSHAAWNVSGIIRFDYAPFWALAGLSAEWVCAAVLRVRLAKDAEVAELPVPTKAPDGPRARPVLRLVR